MMVDCHIGNCRNTNVKTRNREDGVWVRVPPDNVAQFYIDRGVAQLVARLLWEQDVAGSNPVTPIAARMAVDLMRVLRSSLYSAG